MIKQSAHLLGNAQTERGMSSAPVRTQDPRQFGFGLKSIIGLSIVLLGLLVLAGCAFGALDNELSIRVEGSGRVISDPAGIDCTHTGPGNTLCQSRFDEGSDITFTIQEHAGWKLDPDSYLVDDATFPDFRCGARRRISGIKYIEFEAEKENFACVIAFVEDADAIVGDEVLPPAPTPTGEATAGPTAPPAGLATPPPVAFATPTPLPLISLPSDPITIDFDDVVLRPTGTARIRDKYQHLGVIFEGFEPDPGVWGTVVVVIDEQGGNGAFSLPNSVTFGFRGRTVRATFVDPVTGEPAVTDFVSAQVGDKSSEADPITLMAFDVDGQPLGESSFTSIGIGHFGLVSIRTPGIHRVEFRSDDPSGADFDDFTFDPVAAP